MVLGTLQRDHYITQEPEPGIPHPVLDRCRSWRQGGGCNVDRSKNLLAKFTKLMSAEPLEAILAAERGRPPCWRASVKRLLQVKAASTCSSARAASARPTLFRL